MNYLKYFILILIIGLVPLITCQNRQEDLPVNLSHALHLVDSLKVENNTFAYIRIYADYPDYEPVKDPDEGIACVDDVGRFMEVLQIAIMNYNRRDLLPLLRRMTRFILYMEEEGKWYNFIYENGEINKAHINSKLDFSFWAVRALRGLAASYIVLKEMDANSPLLNMVKQAIVRAEKHYQGNALKSGEKPIYLLKNAPDMTSELLLALIKLHNTGDFNYYPEINKISRSLMDQQFINPESALNGMYFCWKNIWHSWGNNQALALLRAYQITKDDRILTSLNKWANNFIEFIIENNFPAEVKIKDGNNYSLATYPQIAYGITSMYRAMQELYKLTGQEKHKARAGRIFAWFQGKNIANVQMYGPQTGRCYDGINKNEVNKNSGAESTIECLLAILARGKF